MEPIGECEFQTKDLKGYLGRKYLEYSDVELNSQFWEEFRSPLLHKIIRIRNSIELPIWENQER